MRSRHPASSFVIRARGLKKSSSALAEQKGLELRIEIDPVLPKSITTDRQRLLQVLKNLLSNSFKFTSQGAITLKITRPEPGTRFRNPLLNAAFAFIEPFPIGLIVSLVSAGILRRRGPDRNAGLAASMPLPIG